MTIPIPSGTRVWLATGHTDTRKGFDGLALLVQEKLKRDPHCGHLFVFRGRRGALDSWGSTKRREFITFLGDAAAGWPLAALQTKTLDAEARRAQLRPPPS